MLSLNNILKDTQVQQEVKGLSDVDLAEYMWANGINNENDYDYIQEMMNVSDFTYGVSKLVLLSKNENIVYKIPFQGSVAYEYNEDENRYEKIDDDDYDYYEGAKNKQIKANFPNWDYCALESELYDEAIELGINDMLAETRLLKTINGFPIYISEKCTDDIYVYEEDVREKSLTQSRTLLSHINTSLSTTNLAKFIEDWGYNKTVMLLNFIKDYNIHDLHSGNVGFNKDNKIVLIDYSDYNS